jgi:hypothetical protein
MASKTKTATQPQNEPTTDRFDALAAHEYFVNGEKRTEWLRVGRAFPNSVGGFNIRLRAIPVATDGEVVVIVKKRDPKDDAAE